MSVVDRLIQARLESGQRQLPDDEESRVLLPTLWEFLTRLEAGDDHTKEGASITIRLGLGSWLVGLSDGSLEVSTTCSVPSLAKALEALEVHVNRPDAAWAPWKASSGKLKKKPKKAD